MPLPLLPHVTCTYDYVCMCQIHTYISTHGTTKRGRDQSHKDDTGDDGHAAPPRKCPKILNDWTQAQPHIDKANRWRQRILAIEERFPTSSFPFRLMTTVIGGMAVVSAHTMYSYHVGGEHNFRSFVETVALDAMLNTYDQDHAPRDHAAAAGETPQATYRLRRGRAGAPLTSRPLLLLWWVLLRTSLSLSPPLRGGWATACRNVAHARG